MKKASKKRVTDRPSAASLREIPEFDFAKAPIVGRGPEGILKVLEWGRVQRSRGRPKKGAASASTATRTIRFSEATWSELEQQAKKRGMTLHALLREVIVKWLERAAA
jgi:hypothetical protein